VLFVGLRNRRVSVSCIDRLVVVGAQAQPQRLAKIRIVVNN
jgi:hypothetical protein